MYKHLTCTRIYLRSWSSAKHSLKTPYRQTPHRMISGSVYLQFHVAEWATVYRMSYSDILFPRQVPRHGNWWNRCQICGWHLPVCISQQAPSIGAFIKAVIPHPIRAWYPPSYQSKITFLINVRVSFTLSFQKVKCSNLIFFGMGRTWKTLTVCQEKKLREIFSIFNTSLASPFSLERLNKFPSL